MSELTVCPHLRKGEPYYRFYTGRGLEVQLLCAACCEIGPIDAAPITEEALEELIDEIDEPRGVRGAPEVRRRPEPFDATLNEQPAPNDVLDFAPGWHFLTANWHLDGVELKPPLAEDRETFAGHVLAPRLHVGGRFVAVVHDFGRFGRVYERATGRVSFELDGGEYHPETVPFSFAFLPGDRAIHRTDWNRLAVSDAATGERLTELAAHDYFHGALYLSPDGSSVLDDGWVWHPYGAPTVQYLDGRPPRGLPGIPYYWNHGMAWLDDTRVAIEGIGEDDDLIIDGACVYDVTDGSSVIFFAGPRGHLFGDGSRLFSSDEQGLSVWDAETGEETGRIDGFCPTRQDRRRRELAQLADGRLRVWRY